MACFTTPFPPISVASGEPYNPPVELASQWRIIPARSNSASRLIFTQLTFLVETGIDQVPPLVVNVQIMGGTFIGVFPLPLHATHLLPSGDRIIYTYQLTNMRAPHFTVSPQSDQQVDIKHSFSVYNRAALVGHCEFRRLLNSGLNVEDEPIYGDERTYGLLRAQSNGSR